VSFNDIPPSDLPTNLPTIWEDISIELTRGLLLLGIAIYFISKK